MANHRRSLRLGVAAAIPAVAFLLAWAVWRGGSGRSGGGSEDAPPPAAKEEGREPGPGAEPTLTGLPLPEDLRLEAAQTVTGTHTISGVVLEPSGEPAKGAEAILIESGTEEKVEGLPVIARASTSVDGTFRISRVGPGPFRLAARLEGYLPAVSETISAGDGDADPAPVELQLKAAASLRGLVVRPDGVPVAGADLRASPASKRQESRAPVRRPFEDLLGEVLARRAAQGRSDASGRFELTGLPGGYYDLAVVADGYGRCEVADAPAGDAALRIVLRPELFLRGEVVDSGEKPIAGAQVRATYLAAEAVDPRAVVARNRDTAEVRQTRSGGDGRFSIGGLAGGAYRVEVDRAGYQSAIASLIPVGESAGGGEGPLVFRLEAGHGIRGSVLSAAGEPLAGAGVRARFVRPIPAGRGALKGGAREEAPAGGELVGSDQPEAAARARADGTFEFTSLASGIYRLEVSAASHRARTIEDLPTGGEPVSIELASATPLTVLVVDGHTQTAIPGASVTRRPAEEKEVAEGAPVLRTDREGRVRLEDLPESAQVIRVEAEGYRTKEMSTEEDGADPELTIALERGGSVSGRVRSSSGSTVEGLRASLVRQGVPATGTEEVASRPEPAAGWVKSEGRSAYTDAAGAFLIPLHQSGSYRVLVEGHPYVSETSPVIEIPDAEVEVKGVDIAVRLAAGVRGLVLDRTGLPVPGAQVLVFLIPGAKAAGSDAEGALMANSGEKSLARSDAVGAFEVSGLREGRFRLIAGAPGYGRVSEVLDLAAGRTSAIEVVLEPELAIAGAVVSPEGDPVPAAEIRAAPRDEPAGESWREERTYSSTPGTFRLGKLANRRYDLRVTATGFASALIEDVPAGSAAVEVRLERPVTLAGKVAGAFTGDPVVEYRLNLEPEEKDRLSAREIESLLRPREFRDSAGAFSIDGLPPGRYSIQIEAPGHLDAGPVAVELPAGEGLAGVEVPLPEKGLLAGTVLDGQSRPVAGAFILAQVRTADPVTGKFEYRSYPVRSGNLGRGRSKGGEKGAGGQKEKGADDRGEPEYACRDRTEGDGRFWLRGLPDAVYRLRTYHDDFVSAETGEQTIEEGSAGDPGLALTVYLDSGTTLFGSVRWMSAVEGGALSLDVSPEGRGAGAGANRGWISKRAQCDDRGHFQVRGLSPGEYVLTARFRRSSDGSPATVRKRISLQEPVREKTIVLDLGR